MAEAKPQQFQPHNGKFIDPDSFLNLFLVIPFSAGEIASLRRTCIWWNNVLVSNTLWKPLFQRDFAPSSSRLQSINTSFLEKENKDTFWYSQYMNVLQHIPKVATLPESFEDCIEIENQDDKNSFDGERSLHKRSTDFSYFKLNTSKDFSQYQIHKLAIILSLLSVNQHFPGTHSKYVDLVKVGIGHEDNWRSYPERTKLIPLSQFCYAVLCGEEERIFTLEDYRRIKHEDPELLSKKYKSEHEHTVWKEPFDSDDEFPVDENSVDSELPLFQVATQANPSDEDYEEFQKEQYTSYWTHERVMIHSRAHVGISPNVEGFFQPFVYYLKVRGACLQEDVYRWKTTERGWAPGFFNASFSWFYHLTMESEYMKDKQAMIVTKTTAREVIN